MASGKVKNEKKPQGGKESVQAPRFFPNLSSLKIEKSNAVESGMMVVVRLPPLSAEERLDADTNAAVMLMVRLDKSAIFEVPRKMFPGNAPLPKLNYLPQHLLPANMEAGGVFAAGALAHKCYPTGLLPSGFRGATPALFVGRRALAKQLQLKNAASLQPRQLRASCSAQRTAGEELPRPPAALARLLPTTPTLRDGHIDYAMGPNISMGVVIAHQTWLEKAREFAGQPLQYRIYTPDLSGVAIMVQQRLRMCVVRLSDVLHPHETSVASHLARDHTTPTFELPKELLLCSGRQLKRDPLYLSRPHLPRGFVAGCVFAPGTMPSRLFNCLPLNVPPLWQRREDVTPPVFLGVWDPDLDPLAQLVPLGSYVKYLEMLPLDPALLAAVQDSTNEQVIVIGGPELPLFEELFPGELPTATNEQEEEKTVVDCVSESDNDIELRKVSKPLTYRESCQLYFGKDTDESSEEEDDGQPASIVTPKKVEAQLKLELEKNQARSEAEAKMVAKKKADETENKLLQESVHIEKTAQTKEPPARINKTAQAKEAAHMTKTKTKSYQFKEPAPINESTQMKTAQAKEAAHMTKTKTKSYQFKEPAPINESTQMTPPPKTSKDSPKKQEMFQAQKDQSMFWPPDPELHTQKVKQRQPLSDIVQNDPQISPEELKHRKRQARIVSVIRWIKQSHEAEFIRTNAQNSAMPSNDDDEEGAMNVNDLLPQFNQILRILEDHLPDEGKPWDMMTQLERAVSNTSDFVLIHIDKVLYNMIKLLTKNQAAASNNGKEQRNQGLQFLQEPISDSNDARSNEPSPPTTTTGEEEPCWLFKLTGNRQKIYRLMRYVQNRGIKVEPVFQPNNADSNAHYRQMRRLCDKIEVQPPPSPQ